MFFESLKVIIDKLYYQRIYFYFTTIDMLDHKKFLEFYNNLDVDQLSSKTVLSFSQHITSDEFIRSVEQMMKSNTTSFYWNLPKDNFSFFAFDELLTFSNEDFDIDKTIGRNQAIKVFTNTKVTLEKEPLFVGGIKFPSTQSDAIWKDFPSSIWFVPKLILVKTESSYSLRYNFILDQQEVHHKIETVNELLKIENHFTRNTNHVRINNINSFSESDIHLWVKQINHVLKEISRNKFSKVVIARQKKLEFAEPPEIFPEIQKLESDYPNCYIFAFKKNDSTFFGSSPERLFSISDGFLETDALAGSAPRGKNFEEDKFLEEELLTSEKNLAEHKSVVDFLLNRLTPISEKILFDTQPSVKKFQNIQHIYSQIRTKLKKETAIFTVLNKLHPTPAVCGMPQDSALASINQIEKFDRGLYSGVLGWFNLNNEGDFAVGIRSAVLNKNELRIFAGCGIVEGSESLSEYNETELKMKPILSLFENETISKS